MLSAGAGAALPLLASPQGAGSAAAAAAARGKTALVTGANSGLGLAACEQLAASGWTVVCAARSEAAAEDAAHAVLGAVPDAAGRVQVARPVELLQLGGVRAAAHGFRGSDAAPRPLDALVLNAGIMAAPCVPAGPHALEPHVAVNHLGHFVLTRALLPSVRAAKGRVVAVSSLACTLSDMPARLADGGDLRGEGLMAKERAGGLGAQAARWRGYADSKAANALFTQELARREARAGTGVAALSCHPGVVATNLIRYLPLPDDVMQGMKDDPAGSQRVARRLGVRTPAEGAVPVVWCAAHPDAAALSGRFVVNPGEAFARLPSKVTDQALADALWSQTEALLGELEVDADAHRQTDESLAV